jgi:hypothetical protein
MAVLGGEYPMSWSWVKLGSVVRVSLILDSNFFLAPSIQASPNDSRLRRLRS